MHTILLLRDFLLTTINDTTISLSAISTSPSSLLSISEHRYTTLLLRDLFISMRNDTKSNLSSFSISSSASSSYHLSSLAVFLFGVMSITVIMFVVSSIITRIVTYVWYNNLQFIQKDRQVSLTLSSSTLSSDYCWWKKKKGWRKEHHQVSHQNPFFSIIFIVLPLRLHTADWCNVVSYR